MAEKMTRRRVEIPVEVYESVEREARWLHVPVTAYVTIVLQDAARANVRQRRQLQKTGSHTTRYRPEPDDGSTWESPDWTASE